MSTLPNGRQFRCVGRFASATLLVAICLPIPDARAGTGDLDPSFGDHGRQSSFGEAGGEVRFVESTDADGLLVWGGDVDVSGNQNYPESCTLRIYGSSFASRIDADGSVSPISVAPEVAGIVAHAITRQADGKHVVVGSRIRRVNEWACKYSSTPVVARLMSDGSLDTTFGINGERELTRLESALALAVDPRNRVVIAGIRSMNDANGGHHELAVLRLRADGSLDGSFGVRGLYAGPVSDTSGVVTAVRPSVGRQSRTLRLLRQDSGAYRVALKSGDQCTLVGITPDGAADTTFGTAGTRTIRDATGGQVDCYSLMSLPDGGLLVGGNAGKRAFLLRLQPDGTPATGFNADQAVSATMTRVTAIAIGNGEKLLVAGMGNRGTSIVRLLADGERDASFGDGGHTWIDLRSASYSENKVQDMIVRADGSVIAAGGMTSGDRPFVVRLLGDGGGMSRGVIGFSRGSATPIELDGKAVVRVRRSGGRDGTVSIGFRTAALDAAESEDFVPRSGRLEWAPGDTSEKAIAIKIADDGVAEAHESFRVVLEDVQGGSGVGSRSAMVDIQPDGSPAGQVQFYDIYSYGPGAFRGTEGSPAQVWLSRDYYSRGRVCVTVSTGTGTATVGQDFIATTSRPCWEDGDTDSRVVEIPLPADAQAEGEETFGVALTNPDGGAILGPRSTATVTITE